MDDPKTDHDPKAGENTSAPGFQQGSASPEDKKLVENSQKHLNNKLDEALEETFPTSDPISVKITK